MAAFKASTEYLRSIHKKAKIALLKFLVVLALQTEYHVDVWGWFGVLFFNIKKKISELEAKFNQFFQINV